MRPLSAATMYDRRQSIPESLKPWYRSRDCNILPDVANDTCSTLEIPHDNVPESGPFAYQIACAPNDTNHYVRRNTLYNVFVETMW